MVQALQAAATVIQRRLLSLYPTVYGAAGIPENMLTVAKVTTYVDAETHSPQVQRTEVGIDRANDDDRVGDGQERLATDQCDRSTDSHAPESVDLNEQAAADDEDCAEPYADDGIHHVRSEHGDDNNDEEEGELVTDCSRLLHGMVLSIGGFLFAKDKNKKDKTYWLCSDRGNCSARMTTMHINE